MARAKPAWEEGLSTFRDGRYFEAHEAFEGLWRASKGRHRRFYQGWVLLAAALFHRDRGNAKGARICLERASERWGSLPGRFAGWDLPGTLGSVREVLPREWACPLLPEAGPELSGPGPNSQEEIDATN